MGKFFAKRYGIVLIIALVLGVIEAFFGFECNGSKYADTIAGSVLFGVIFTIIVGGIATCCVVVIFKYRDDDNAPCFQELRKQRKK